MVPVLWVFPSDDFERWNAETQNGEFTSYQEYLEMVEAARSGLGENVVIVEYPYDVLLLWLVENGLDNTPENRARAHVELSAVIELREAQRECQRELETLDDEENDE